jgi:ABC-type multidrug transport system ATPase subunit
VALVGASGAGKSTLLAVLMRFLDYEGSATLGGVELRDMAGDDVRRLVTGVTQDAHVFQATIRANLALARPGATEAELRDAAARARLLSWVEAQPAGWDTELGTDGAGLSGGERLRLLLARALLADPPVLVLDEPTEGLDRDTAGAVLTDLLDATRGRTTLLVTHDPAVVAAADHVVELAEGRLSYRAGVHPIVDRLRADLAAQADPAAAVEMQRYMKSAMPFRGVAKPARDRLMKDAVATHPVGGPAELDAAVRELWDAAEFREERYLALSLTGHRRYLPWLDPSWVPLMRHWIVTGAWWDFTDEIASRRIGPLLLTHRDALRPVVRGWITDPDRWLRRTSVICQLQARGATDTALLTEAIEANIADPDFFLRKGIGWALRQHARTDPEWVRGFVADHPGLSLLSRREALRHLGG